MDHLWAPWRMAYVSAAKPAFAASDCFICHGLAADDDKANLIVMRTPRSVVFLNRFPYNNGHLLIAPTAHKARLDQLDFSEMLETQESLRRMICLLDSILKPEGYNVGLNLGSAAGAGVPGHLHWHLVPRWTGDTNFMPVVASTRVIVQSLDSLFDLLQERLRSERAGVDVVL